MEKKLQTPSQTIGPYFAYGLTPQQYGYDFNSWATTNLVEDDNTENIITITGQVFDGEGNPINDAMIEVWQNDKEAQLFGRYGTGTDKENRFTFKTIKPKALEGNAPFLSVILFMRGLLVHLYTRIYFSDEQTRNENDKTLMNIPEDRRATLIAQKKGDVYEFNIHMQGEKETVFFDV